MSIVVSPAIRNKRPELVPPQSPDTEFGIRFTDDSIAGDSPPMHFPTESPAHQPLTGREPATLS